MTVAQWGKELGDKNFEINLFLMIVVLFRVKKPNRQLDKNLNLLNR